MQLRFRKFQSTFDSWKAMFEQAAASGTGSLEDVEKTHVAAVLKSCHGNVSHAARVLGIDRVTLYNKIKKYGLRRDEAPASARR